MSSSTAARPVSVVIPTHDTEELTRRCLGSLAALPRQPREVLVIEDGGSYPSASSSYKARWPSLTVLRLDARYGFARAANEGLAKASSPYLLLLNSDTEVQPGALDAVLRAFEESPELGIAGGELRYADGEPQWSGGAEPTLSWFFALASGLPLLLERLPLYRRVHPLDHRRRVDWVSGAAMAMRREVWEAVGPFDEELGFYAQDLDLCLRAREVGWQVAIVSGFEVVHHRGKTVEGLGGAVVGPRGTDNPALLWSDLMRWASKHRGPAWARRARAALELGGRLRLAAGRLTSAARHGERRQRWRRLEHAYRDALLSIRV